MVVAVTVLAGCGAQRPSEPHLPRPLAAAWQREADSVADALAAGDRCLARRRAVSLQTSVIEAVNERRLGSQFQEPLLGAVNELVSRIRCRT
jgi:hypothetical protein